MPQIPAGGGCMIPPMEPLPSLMMSMNALRSERAGQLTAVSTEQSFAYWRALGTIYGGWVKVKYGEVAEGMRLVRVGSTAYCATGAAAWGSLSSRPPGQSMWRSQDNLKKVCPCWTRRYRSLKGQGNAGSRRS